MSYGQRPEAIDTRWIFRGYAVLAVVAGFLLMAWGPMWLGTDLAGEKWAKAALIRVFGAIVAAGACCAEGFARVDHPPDRRQALLWFTAAHSVVALAVISQLAVWGHGLGEETAVLLVIIVALLLYFTATAEGEPLPRTLTTLFGSDRPTFTAELRSQYEQQIREAARQEERNRLARDLHDSIKQQIFAVQTAAATVQARFDGDATGAREALEQVRGAAREAMAEMQAMLDQLRAVPLENSGLIEALKKQCEALGFRTGAHVEFKLGVLPATDSLPPGAHEAMLRVAQEALANVGRHARAHNVLVSITSLLGRVELRVEDDGAGFDPAHSPRGQGIANMRARAEEFGGTLDLNSRPGAGTSIVFSIPYTATEAPEEYRLKAVISGVLFTALMGLLVWRRDPIFIFLETIAAAWTARYLVAYRRVRGRREAAR